MSDREPEVVEVEVTTWPELLAALWARLTWPQAAVILGLAVVLLVGALAG